MGSTQLKADGRRKAWNRSGRGADGLSREIEQPCERDIRVFAALEKYPILDVDHLFALVGGKDRARFVERLRLLSDPPNNFIVWPKQQTRRANNYLKNGLYARSRKPRKLLERRGLPINQNPYSEYNDLFEHQYLAYATFASIEVGGADLTVLHRPPLEVRISRKHDGESQRKTFEYTPDGFASITFPNGLSGYLQLEVENENTVDRGNLEQPSFIRKLLAIRYIMENELYEKKWGFPHLLTLFVSPYPEKIAEMKRVVLRETNGQGLSYLLFQEIVGFDHPYKSFKPRPELFTGTWERTGKHAPFSLSTPPRA
jgi:hypothetical protein